MDRCRRPSFAADDGRKFISLAESLGVIRDYLYKAEMDDRQYLRFFTLTHLYNNPKVNTDDLRVYQAALSKALNSLSWKAGIVLPKPIDKAETIFVIDVRKLDWDRYNLWNEIVKVYPYGLRYRNADHPLYKLDQEIFELSHCDLPYIRTDWFVATATRPPLYHTLLQLPKQARELEQRLGVDVVANFREDKLARGGFAKSGVSAQNRLVERHDSSYGAYWKSYDFKPELGRSWLVRFPLGPQNLFPPGQHPYEKQAFIQAGGEFIFNLPNGLQGYMLVDGNDNRIDEGPIQVVADDNRTAGTPAIVPGLSCMHCHTDGVIPFTDSIRTGAAVFGNSQKKVLKLYPEKSEMDRLVQADQQRFHAALEKAIGPILRVGPDKDKPIESFKEPVGQIAKFYRTGHLDLRRGLRTGHREAGRFERSRPKALQGVGPRRLTATGRPDRSAGMGSGRGQLADAGRGPRPGATPISQ